MKFANRMYTLLFVLMALTGCPQQASTANAANTPTTQPAQSAAAPQEGQRPAPPMSTQMPPQVMPPQAMPQLVTIDYACHTDSDCAIKDVGSCCGAKPECVNKDSPADPAGVRAQCTKDHRMSSCAIRQINQCGCQQGRCAPKDEPATPLVPAA